MKKVVKAYAFALETVPLFGLVYSGCSPAATGHSQSAEFPEIERQWQ